MFSWDADIHVGEELHCQGETGNPWDPFAVAVIRASVTVGHVERLSDSGSITITIDSCKIVTIAIVS